MDSIKSIEFKVDAGLNFNMAMNKVDGKDFEKMGLGRPKGDWDTKRKQYFDMINNGKSKNLEVRHWTITMSKKVMMENVY